LQLLYHENSEEIRAMTASRKIETGITGQIEYLERTYIIDDRLAVLSFIERNRLRDLLLEASNPLQNAFGNMGSRKTLRLIRDDEGIDTLFCLVQFRGSVEAGMEALACFDEQWWLDRSERSQGKLNFDFEFV
jgi:hypothetical protein